MATESARPSLSDIAENNPDVDSEAVAKTLKAVRELRKHGADGPHYGLASPYGHEAHSDSEVCWTG